MDIQATEAAQALGYADMTDDFDARAAVAAALFSYGFPEEGDRVLDGLVQVCVRRPWMEAALLPLLVSAGRNAKATALARRLGKAAGGDWECWSSVARTLADAAEPVVTLGARERLLLLVDIVRAIDRQGLRGICAVECVEALLKAGLVEAGVALLRDGGADMRASATRPARRCAERW